MLLESVILAVMLPYLIIYNRQMNKNKLLLTFLLLFTSVLAFAQNLTVTGTVKDSSTGDPVPFAAIQL
jgi:hypothetical protein